MSVERTGASIPPIPTEANRSDRDRWKKPEPGQSVAGIVWARFERKFKYPKNPDVPTFEVLVVRRSDGGIEEIPCGRAELRRMLSEKDPQPGDAISLIYTGMEDNTHMYGWTVVKAAAA
jgi:hypothetical protein